MRTATSRLPVSSQPKQPSQSQHFARPSPHDVTQKPNGDPHRPTLPLTAATLARRQRLAHNGGAVAPKRSHQVALVTPGPPAGCQLRQHYQSHPSHDPIHPQPDKENRHPTTPRAHALPLGRQCLTEAGPWTPSNQVFLGQPTDFERQLARLHPLQSPIAPFSWSFALSSHSNQLQVEATGKIQRFWRRSICRHRRHIQVLQLRETTLHTQLLRRWFERLRSPRSLRPYEAVWRFRISRQRMNKWRARLQRRRRAMACIRSWVLVWRQRVRDRQGRLTQACLCLQRWFRRHRYRMVSQQAPAPLQSISSSSPSSSQSKLGGPLADTMDEFELFAQLILPNLGQLAPEELNQLTLVNTRSNAQTRRPLVYQIIQRPGARPPSPSIGGWFHGTKDIARLPSSKSHGNNTPSDPSSPPSTGRCRTGDTGSSSSVELHRQRYVRWMPTPNHGHSALPDDLRRPGRRYTMISRSSRRPVAPLRPCLKAPQDRKGGDTAISLDGPLSPIAVSKIVYESEKVETWQALGGEGSASPTVAVEPRRDSLRVTANRRRR